MIDKNIIIKFLNGQVQFKRFDKNHANLAKNRKIDQQNLKVWVN